MFTGISVHQLNPDEDPMVQIQRILKGIQQSVMDEDDDDSIEERTEHKEWRTDKEHPIIKKVEEFCQIYSSGKGVSQPVVEEELDYYIQQKGNEANPIALFLVNQMRLFNLYDTDTEKYEDYRALRFDHLPPHIRYAISIGALPPLPEKKHYYKNENGEMEGIIAETNTHFLTEVYNKLFYGDSAWTCGEKAQREKGT